MAYFNKEPQRTLETLQVYVFTNNLQSDMFDSQWYPLNIYL